MITSSAKHVRADADMVRRVVDAIDSWYSSKYVTDTGLFRDEAKRYIGDSMDRLGPIILENFKENEKTSGLYETAKSAGMSDDNLLEMIHDRSSLMNNVRQYSYNVILYIHESEEQELDFRDIFGWRDEVIRRITADDCREITRKNSSGVKVLYRDVGRIDVVYDRTLRIGYGLSPYGLERLTDQINDAIDEQIEGLVEQSDARGPATDDVVYRVKHPMFAGFYLADLPAGALKDEGEQQRICVGDPQQGYIGMVYRKTTKILSLRSPTGKTVLTFEIDVSSDDRRCNQIKGKANRLPGFDQAGGTPKFIKPQEVEVSVEVLRWLGIAPDSVEDLRPGLLALEKGKQTAASFVLAGSDVHCGFCRRSITKPVGADAAFAFEAVADEIVAAYRVRR
jgi:hypothetical protein